MDENTSGDGDRSEGRKSTTRLDRYLIIVIICAAIMLTTVIAMDGVKQAVREYTFRVSNVDRWVYQSEYSDSWMIFDTETGRLCAIPKDNSGGGVVCTPKPSEY